MITVTFAALLLIAAIVGVGTREAASVGGTVVVMLATVAVSAPLFMVSVRLVVTNSVVSVAVSVVLAVSLLICATCTPTVWVSSVLDKRVARSVAWTMGVSATGSAVSSATTAAGATRPRSWAIKPVLPADGKKAKRSPNQPRPAPLIITKLSMATNGNSTVTANPRRSSVPVRASTGVVDRHWLLCKKALANSLALA